MLNKSLIQGSLSMLILRLLDEKKTCTGMR